MRLPGGVRGAVWLAAAAVSLGLSPVVAGGTWAVQALLAAGVVVGVGALLARTRLGEAPSPSWRTAAVAVLQLLALLVLLSFLFAPAQALVGLVPGPAAWRHLAELAGQGRTSIAAESAPLTADPGVRLLTTTGAGLLALAVDVLAVGLRRPALAGLPLLAVHCTAIVFAPGGLSWWWFALAALGYALLLAADAAPRVAGWGRLVQRRPATGGAPPAARFGGAGRTAAAVAVLGAVVVPSVLPGTSTGFLLPGGGSGTVGGQAIDAVNPFIDMRSDLGAQGDAEVLSYRTDVASPPPLRIVTVDTFDGQTWRPTAPDRSTLRGGDGAKLVPPGLDPATPRARSRYTIEVGALRQQWLPMPYPAEDVSVDGDWRYDPATLNVLGAHGTRTQEGQRYTVDYLQVTPTSQQLAEATIPADVATAYGTPPANLPAKITQVAQDATKGASTPYLKAVALQSFFRSTGGFTYSTSAPEPHSASALADFLTDRTGYCVHFASAMALMARTLGIPARVAVGFLPGSQDNSGRWHVTLRDAHAWPELYFAGAGWVRFEPTPASRTGAVPSWTVPAVVPTGPAAAAGPAPSVAAPSAAAQAAQDEATRRAASTGAASGVRIPWQLPVVVAVLAGLAAAPLVSRSVVRRRRWQRATGPAERAEAAWTDLVEQVGDLGIGVPASATPRQVGERLGTSGQDAAVHRLVTAVEQSRYAAPEPASTDDGLRGDVRTVVRALAADRPRSATWRWRLLPPSGVAHLRTAPRRLRAPARRPLVRR